MITDIWRIRASAVRVLKNAHFHPTGHHIGHAHMVLGLLYKAKKKRDLAIHHLNEARRIFAEFGHTPILMRLNGSLAEMGQ